MARGPYTRRKPTATAPKPASSRPDPRPELRAEARVDDPRARASARAALLREHLGDIDEGQDKFYVDPHAVPDGWSYEWKVRSVVGLEDPARQVAQARMGWEPVPVDRHPSFMPEGYHGKTIERDGMVLMERPKEITDEIKDIELRKARAQVRTKEEQLNSAPQGHFERDSDPRTRAKITKTYEAIPIPE